MHYQQVGYAFGGSMNVDAEPVWEDTIEYNVDWIDCTLMPEGFDPRNTTLALPQRKEVKRKK
jgi:hypothetical protein